MGTWAVQADPRLSTPHRGQYFGACGKDKGCKKGWHVGGKGGKTEEDAHFMSLSRKLTWILRHGPAEAHVEIDNQGWVDVAQLLQSPVMRAFKPSVHMIRHIVVTCRKLTTQSGSCSTLHVRDRAISCTFQPSLPAPISWAISCKGS